MGGLLVSQSSGAMNDQALSADGATTSEGQFIHPNSRTGSTGKSSIFVAFPVAPKTLRAPL